MGWFWIAFACRPHVLWRNPYHKLWALLAFLVDLADTCQGQVKCELVVAALKGMVFLVLPLLSNLSSAQSGSSWCCLPSSG